MDSHNSWNCRILQILGILGISDILMLREGLGGIAGEIRHVVQSCNPAQRLDRAILKSDAI